MAGIIIENITSSSLTLPDSLSGETLSPNETIVMPLSYTEVVDALIATEPDISPKAFSVAFGDFDTIVEAQVGGASGNNIVFTLIGDSPNGGGVSMVETTTSTTIHYESGVSRVSDVERVISGGLHVLGSAVIDVKTNGSQFNVLTSPQDDFTQHLHGGSTIKNGQLNYVSLKPATLSSTFNYGYNADGSTVIDNGNFNAAPNHTDNLHAYYYDHLTLTGSVIAGLSANDPGYFYVSAVESITVDAYISCVGLNGLNGADGDSGGAGGAGVNGFLGANSIPGGNGGGNAAGDSTDSRPIAGAFFFASPTPNGQIENQGNGFAGTGDNPGGQTGGIDNTPVDLWYPPFDNTFLDGYKFTLPAYIAGPGVSGAGGGGSSGGNFGGGGGSGGTGGGIIVLRAPLIKLTSNAWLDVRAGNGGNGGNGATTGNTGGGAGANGGNAGMVVLICDELLADGANFVINGGFKGLGGTGHGSSVGKDGADGADGLNGIIYIYQPGAAEWTAIGLDSDTVTNEALTFSLVGRKGGQTIRDTIANPGAKTKTTLGPRGTNTFIRQRTIQV